MPTVTLGTSTIQLRRPASATQRYEIWLASVVSPDRAFAAALGSCLPAQGKGAPLELVHRYEMTYSPLAYGGQVLDELLDKGLSRAEIRTAGIIAHNFISEEFVDDAGLPAGADAEQRTEDFSAAPGSAT